MAVVHTQTDRVSFSSPCRLVIQFQSLSAFDFEENIHNTLPSNDQSAVSIDDHHIAIVYHVSRESGKLQDTVYNNLYRPLDLLL